MADKKKETIRTIRAKLGKIGYDPVDKLVDALSQLEEDLEEVPPKARTSMRRIQIEALVQLAKISYMSASDEKFLEDEEDSGPVRPMLIVKTVGAD